MEFHFISNAIYCNVSLASNNHVEYIPYTGNKKQKKKEKKNSMFITANSWLHQPPNMHSTFFFNVVTSRQSV